MARIGNEVMHKFRVLQAGQHCSLNIPPPGGILSPGEAS